MRVAFISGNRELLPDPVIPLGILWVASSLPPHHQKTVIDLCFEDQPFEVVRERLTDFRPDVVALGMRNIQNADYSDTSGTIAFYAKLLKTIRATTTVPVVMGGSGFSVMPTELMEELRPDYGISGEAELSFPALIDALEKSTSLDHVGNLHRFADDELVCNGPAAEFLDMDELPIPDRDFVDVRHYQRHGIEGVQTKRGCPLRCEYCTYPLIEGRVGRVRSPEVVVDEIEAIVQRRPDLKHFFIVDSVFNLPRRHAKAVCREMIERKLALSWTCYANPLGFDAELAELMAAANCAGMEVGADSGSDAVLDALNKGFTTGQIRKFNRLARDAGIPDCHTFLLGTPGETLDDVRHTLDFIVDLDPFSAILMAWIDDYEALDPVLAAERRRLRESVLELLDQHRSEFPWWIIPALGVNYNPELFELLRTRGFHGPLWQHIRGLVEPVERRRLTNRPQRPTERDVNEADESSKFRVTISDRRG